jgi:hypothetical protein
MGIQQIVSIAAKVQKYRDFNISTVLAHSIGLIQASQPGAFSNNRDPLSSQES